MKKFSKIEESIWSDMQRRAEGTDIRKEDIFGNIKELVPVDMGGSVLWANDDFCYDGEYLFTYDEAMNMLKNKKWRLPTIKEVSELDRSILHTEEDSYTLEKNKTPLKFYKRGIIHHSLGKLIDLNYYYAWTSEEYKLNSIHIFTIDEGDLHHSPVYDKSVTKQVVQDKSDKLCIRLVKDK